MIFIKQKTKRIFTMAVSNLLSILMATTLAAPTLATDEEDKTVFDEVNNTQTVTGIVPVEGTIGVTGHIVSGTVLSVTVPTALVFALTPADEEVPVITLPIEFSNQTPVDVTVDFMGIKSSSDTSAKVVNPTKFSDWDILGEAETTANIAFGLKEEGKIYWAHDEEKTKEDPDGVINLSASGHDGSAKMLDLSVKAGREWRESAKLSYTLDVRVALAK